MRKIISLRLGWGSLESGFLNILVKIYQEDKLIEEIDIGSLPPNHEIAKNYQFKNCTEIWLNTDECHKFAKS